MTYAVPNLASRVLGLSARWLCGDMLARRGHPVLLAETFVDPALYRGTCYRAAGWEEVGETRGYARRRGGWEEHGCRKRVFVKPLAKAARTALSGGAEPSEWGCSAGRAPPPGRMRSLYDFLRSVPDYRSARGVRHRLATVLAVALASKLAGVRGVTAIAEFADRLTQAQLAAVRARLSPSTGRRVPPSRTSFHRILSELDPDALERALRKWAVLGGTPGAPVAVDGKSAPGWVRGPSGDRMLIAAVEHGSGVTLGQTASDSAGSEIVGARRLLSELDIRGRVVTIDALQSCPRTAAHILERGADYLATVKGNGKTLLDDIRGLDWDAAPAVSTTDKGHGRIEVRRCRAVAITAPPADCADLPGRRQAFRVERERTLLV